MSDGDELEIADQWLYETLAADDALAALVGDPKRIFADQADPGTTGLTVIFGVLSPDDVLTATGGERVMVDALYLVKAVASQDDAEDWLGVLRDAARRIDAVLHKAAGTAAGGFVFSCIRQRPFRLVENDEAGVQHRHRGGEYRLLIQH